MIKDPNILLSVINTKLRDFYSSLDDLCDDLDYSKEEVEKRLNSGEHFVIRFKMPENQNVDLYDEIRFPPVGRL